MLQLAITAAPLSDMHRATLLPLPITCPTACPAHRDVGDIHSNANDYLRRLGPMPQSSAEVLLDAEAGRASSLQCFFGLSQHYRVEPSKALTGLRPTSEVESHMVPSA